MPVPFDAYQHTLLQLCLIIRCAYGTWRSFQLVCLYEMSLIKYPLENQEKRKDHNGRPALQEAMHMLVFNITNGHGQSIPSCMRCLKAVLLHSNDQTGL